MSTPPFIAVPEGVRVVVPPTSPAPLLVAEPSWTGVSGEPQSDTGRSGAGTAGAGAGTPTPAGTAASRGDVLLVPGFTGSKEDYIAILRPLADRGWRVATMDLPGQGGFPGLGAIGSHTPASLATSVVEVADWFAPDRPVHLVGHSMGGLVTREVLIARPDRLTSLTAVCSGRGAIPLSGHKQLTNLQAMLAAAPMEQIWQIKEALDRANGWNPPSEEVAEFCARRFIANDPAAMHDFADILQSTPDRTPDAASAAASTGVRTAVVTGELDDAWPLDEQEAMATELGAPWRIIPAVGHNPSTEDPETTAAVLDEIFSLGPL